jgi:hypothetical protein
MVKHAKKKTAKAAKSKAAKASKPKWCGWWAMSLSGKKATNPLQVYRTKNECYFYIKRNGDKSKRASITKNMDVAMINARSNKTLSPEQFLKAMAKVYMLFLWVRDDRSRNE